MPKRRNKKQQISETVEEDKTYEVEEILDQRVTDGRSYYYLKWRGFDE
jgi:uncharacterized protein involved in tolerance to divalent cations